VTPTADLRALIESLRREHYDCEDCWYSCPKSEGGCCDDAQTGCTCGADAHNARVNEALAHIDSYGAGRDH
jgi:hypothetical protein